MSSSFNPQINSIHHYHPPNTQSTSSMPIALSITPAQAFAYLLQPLANDPVLAATATNLLYAMNKNSDTHTEIGQLSLTAAAGFPDNLSELATLGLPTINSQQEERNRDRMSCAISTDENQASLVGTYNEGLQQPDHTRDTIQANDNITVTSIEIQKKKRKKKKAQELTFICGKCGKAFGRLYNLQSHEKTHRDERPFSCQYCDAKFSRNHDLTRHSKCHTENRYVCQHCGRTFSRRDSLQRHERMDPEGKRMHCSLSPTAPNHRRIPKQPTSVSKWCKSNDSSTTIGSNKRENVWSSSVIFVEEEAHHILDEILDDE